MIIFIHLLPLVSQFCIQIFPALETSYCSLFSFCVAYVFCIYYEFKEYMCSETKHSKAVIFLIHILISSTTH